MYRSIRRRTYIERIRLAYQGLADRATSDSPIVIQLIGSAGSGKSTILDQAAEDLWRRRTSRALVVDTEARERHTLLALLTLLADQLVSQRRPLGGFQAELIKYQSAPSDVKTQAYDSLLSSFRRAWTVAAEREPIVVFLDSCEKSVSGANADSPTDLVRLVNGRTLLVLASQISIRTSGGMLEEIPVADLSEGEVSDLDDLMAEDSTSAVPSPARAIVREVWDGTRGRPLTVRLALAAHYEGWLDLQETVPFRLADLGREAMVAMDKNAPDLSQLCRVLSVVVHRVDDALIAEITGIGLADVSSALQVGIRVGIIRRIEDGTVRLHEEAVALLRRINPLTGKARADLVSRAVAAYERRMEAAPENSDARIEAEAERIFYLSSLDSRQAGTAVLDVVSNALYGNDVEMARRLAAIAIPRAEGADLGARVALAGVANMSFWPAEALTVLAELSPDEEQSRPAVSAAWYMAKADALTNPCTLLHVDPTDAISALSEANRLYQASGDRVDGARALAKRGYVHMLLGQHDKAEESLREAVDASRHIDRPDLLATSLDYLGELYRLIQDLDRAEPPLLESQQLRIEIGSGLTNGYTLFCLGNLARDRSDYDGAELFYADAASVFRRTGDHFRLHECLNDQSWLYFLKGDTSAASTLLDEEFGLIQRYAFGSGLSLYHHGRYHLSADLEEWTAADASLAKGLTAVRQFPHTYMLVDLLHHEAQRAYRVSDFANVMECYNELQAVEDRGCLIRVFRGRTMLILGDCRADSGDLGEAVDWWMRGLLIVALHGDSRTNVELFDDMLSLRSEKLVAALSAKADRTRWRQAWGRAEATKGYAVLWGPDGLFT